MVLDTSNAELVASCPHCLRGLDNDSVLDPWLRTATIVEEPEIGVGSDLTLLEVGVGKRSCNYTRSGEQEGSKSGSELHVGRLCLKSVSVNFDLKTGGIDEKILVMLLE
jgi:hypothetical protein